VSPHRGNPLTVSHPSENIAEAFDKRLSPELETAVKSLSGYEGFSDRIKCQLISDEERLRDLIGIRPVQTGRDLTLNLTIDQIDDGEYWVGLCPSRNNDSGCRKSLRSVTAKIVVAEDGDSLNAWNARTLKTAAERQAGATANESAGGLVLKIEPWVVDVFSDDEDWSGSGSEDLVGGLLSWTSPDTAAAGVGVHHEVVIPAISLLLQPDRWMPRNTRRVTEISGSQWRATHGAQDASRTLTAVQKHSATKVLEKPLVRLWMQVAPQPRSLLGRGDAKYKHPTLTRCGTRSPAF